MNKKLIYSAIFAATLSVGLTSCDEEKLNSESIFEDVAEERDPESLTYKFDKWLDREYGERYNMEFRYKMQHISTDMTYNLVPTELQKAIDMALLNKYLWYDVYAKLVGDDFLKRYGPKIMQLIGSPAYNPANHTMILGLAEGGLKVSLFRCNSLNVNDFGQLNQYYFKTMHHEFSHILHQTKTYPVEFNTLNQANYEPGNWQDRNGAIVASFGCATRYGSSQQREDFAEICANYITRTYDQWDLLLWIADRDWETTYSDDYAYFCYYYASESDRDEDIKTYCGEFVEPEDGTNNYGIRCVTRTTGSASAKTDNKGNNGSICVNVEETEAYLAKLKANFDIIPCTSTDNKNGKEILLQKVSIIRQWFKDAWGLDIDALRDEVQYRQTHIDIEALRAEVENME